MTLSLWLFKISSNGFKNLVWRFCMSLKLKKLFLVNFFLFLCVCIFAQSETNQMVFPKKIYLGDTAEIHYIFRSGVEFFPGETNLDEKPLYLLAGGMELETENYSITKAVIQRNGPMYTVVLTFIPWKTGKITFPEFDLLAAVFNVKSSVPFYILLEPVEISSIIPKGEDISLQEIESPLLVPGTIYVVYAIAVIVLILLILLVRTFVKRKEILAALKTRKILRMYAKNASKALRQFRKLAKNSSKLSDEAFCLCSQQILRVYLSTRFGVNFCALATNQIANAFDDVSSGLLGEEKSDQVEELVGIFMRCDYIRFAHQSLLNENERPDLIKRACTIIKVFEGR